MKDPYSLNEDTLTKGVEHATIAQAAHHVRWQVLEILGQSSPQEFYNVICEHIHWSYDKELRKDEGSR